MKLTAEEAIRSLDSIVKNAETRSELADVSEDVMAILNEGAPAEFVTENGKAVVADISKAIAAKGGRRRRLSDFPPVIREDENENILIKGRWLERGGSAFLVSTAGTGKSIWMTQFAISMIHAVPFSGLTPWKPLKCWVIQSEDSDDRVSIDRDDIIAGIIEENEAENPEINWESAAQQVIFVDLTGHTGADFLHTLKLELESARATGDLPDVVIINPFMDFLGADVTSNADTIAFLSGGVLAGKQTEGLRSILRDFHIAALIAHHTAKPPTDAELAGWIMSAMPEYKACGAGYITNWGRSFITLMKIPGVDGKVMLTAGKNGGGLGWPLVHGARRIFLSHSDAESCGGSGRRHHWHMVTDEDELEDLKDAVGALVDKRQKRGRDPKKDIDVEASAMACCARVREFVNVKKTDLYSIWHEQIGKTEYSRESAKKVIDHVFSNPPEGCVVRRIKKNQSVSECLIFA